MYFKESISFFTGFVLSTCLMGFYLVGYELGYFPGDLGDARFNLYIIEHAWRFLTGEVPSLWNAPFMHPEEQVVTYSDNLLGNAPLYGIFRLLGADRITAFQCWTMLMVMLNYACCYLFLRYLIKDSYAATIGAMVFSMSIVLHPQALHAQTFPRFPIPLAFLTGLIFYERLQPVYFFLTLLLLVYQFYCGIYLGFLLAIPLAIFLMLSMIFRPRDIFIKARSLKWITTMLASLVVNILILLPLMLPYERRSDKVTYDPYEALLSKLPTLFSYIHSPPDSFAWGWLSGIGDHLPQHWNQELFTGGIGTVSLLGLVFFSIKCLLNKQFSNYFNRRFVTLGLTAMFTFFLFTRFGDFSLYRLLYELPGYASMSAVHRVINVQLIFMATGAALLSYLLIQVKPKLSFFIFIAIVAALLLDNYHLNKTDYRYRTPKSTYYKRLNGVKKKMNDIPEGSVVSYEPKDSLLKQEAAIIFQLDAMLASQHLNLKCVNGYSGSCPGEFGPFWRKPNKKNRKKWLTSENPDFDTVHVVR